MKVLILGGTAEARALAEAFVAAGIPVLSSLAGRVSHPRLPAGEVRIGGFGGAAGLAGFLRSNGITRVVDATHPFAIRVSTNAAEACTQAGVPLLRLVRPGWENEPAASRWIWVDDHDEAAWQAARLGRRVLLTTGRQTLHHFIGPLAEHTVLARVVEDVELALPPTWILIRSRGPYTCAGERKLMASMRWKFWSPRTLAEFTPGPSWTPQTSWGFPWWWCADLLTGDVPTVADVPLP